tara:strand:+ start:875 stop:1483 length:609 start_codon:yes stop_codon:yes gene_type:complete
MALTLNGSNNTIGGLAVGGLPDNTIDNGCMADDSVGIADLSATGTASSSTFLRGDNAWAAAGILQYSEGTVTSISSVSSTSKTYINMYNTITPVASDSTLVFILAVGVNRESTQKSFSLSVSKDDGSNYYWHSGGTNISWHNSGGTGDDLYWQEGPFMWTETAGTAGTAETHKVYSDLDETSKALNFNLYTKGIINCWEVAA